jgi:hypothetical protein
MAIKTVTCAACGAEQAILRDEDGKMKCVFCGEPIDLPEEQQEGEGLDYSYDIPEEETQEKLEPVGEKIDAVFVLNEQEVGTAFTVSGKLKERKFILYIELALLALIGTGTLVMAILGLLGKEGIQKPELVTWLYVVLCYGMIPVVLTMPKRTKKKIIRNATSGNQLTVSIYENLLNIHIDGREEKDDWQQPFDGSFGLIHEQGLFVLTLQNGQILVIPERSLTQEQVEIVKDRLQTKS